MVGSENPPDPLTRHFGWLVREAEVDARGASAHVAALADAIGLRQPRCRARGCDNMPRAFINPMISTAYPCSHACELAAGTP